jgi:hypothetical protein
MKLGPRWSFRAIPRGTHVEVAIRHGTIGSRALLGTLTMDDAEWRELAHVVLQAGADVVDETRVGR